VHTRAKVTIESLYEVVYEKSIGIKMNDLDLCLEVVSRSCRPLRCIRQWISWKPLEIEAWFQRTPIGYGLRGIKWSRYRWHHVAMKGQTRDPNTLMAQYLLRTAGDAIQ